MDHLADILVGTGTDISRVIKNCRIISLWGEVVNERVSRNTEPIKIKNKVLYVSAATPTWAQELAFLKKEIVKKFNDRAGEDVISDIRFRTACQ